MFSDALSGNALIGHMYDALIQRKESRQLGERTSVQSAIPEASRGKNEICKEKAPCHVWKGSIRRATIKQTPDGPINRSETWG